MKRGRLVAALVVASIIVTMLSGIAAASDLEEEVWVYDWTVEDGRITDADWDYLTIDDNAFYSIQEAINNVAEGGVVNVLPGTYEEGLVDDEYPSLYFLTPLTLQGVDFQGNVIESKNDVQAVIVGLSQTDTHYSYAVFTDNVTITGLELQPGYDQKNLLGDDYYVSESVIRVEGNNFTLKHSQISPAHTAPADCDSLNLHAITFVGEETKAALVEDNNLFGNLQFSEGAGEESIKIKDNLVKYSSFKWEKSSGDFDPIIPILVNEAYLPEIEANDFVEELFFDDYFVIVALAVDGLDAQTWLSGTLTQNTFTEAVVVVEPLTMETKLVEDACVAFNNYEWAAEFAEDGDIIIVFYPSADSGVTFDAALIPDDGQVAFASDGLFTFVHKGSLPDPEAEYTVTITGGDPPAEAPAGYTIINAANFAISCNTTPFTDFVDGYPATFWINLGEDGFDPDALAFFYYNSDAGEWEELDFEFANGSILIIETSHWSYFALMQESDGEPSTLPGAGTSDEKSSTLPRTGTPFVWLVPLGVLMLLAGLISRKKAIV